MRIIELLNTINSDIYFNNVFECLFGTRDYRVKQAFLQKINLVGLSNSSTTGEITVNTKKSHSIEIICKKPFFFKQNFNSFQNMRMFKQKMGYIYDTIDNFINIHSKYTKYTNTITFNKNTISIH